MDKKFFTKKKLIVFGGIVIVLFLIVWFLFNFYYLELFAGFYKDTGTFNAISNREDVTIKHNFYNDKYFEGMGIKFLNIFGDCYLSSEGKDYSGYICDKGAFVISTVSGFVSSFNKGDFINSDISSSWNKKIHKEFLRRHNIKNDDDIIEFLGNYKEKELSVLNSYNDINDDYVVSDLLSMFPTYDKAKFYMISGDYKGYSIESDSSYMFYLKNNDMYYRILFGIKNSDLTRDDIYKVISSVVIGQVVLV